MPVRINGATSGSVTLDAPATGSNVTLTLPGVTDTLMRQGGGKILQIVRGTDTTDRSTTSTSYVDSNISVTITPQRSDSAILLIGSVVARQIITGTTFIGVFTTITDSSNNAISGTENVALDNADIRQITAPVTMIGRATPATTSATTYKIRFRSVSSAQTAQLLNANTTGQLYAIEVSA